MQLYSHIQRARSKLSTCWDGAVYVHVLCVYLPQSACLPAEVAWPSLLSRSGQQVLGSCGLAQLSLEAGPVWRLYVGHRERKGTPSNTLALHL